MLLHNGNSCPQLSWKNKTQKKQKKNKKIISCRRLKTHRHSVSIGPSCSGFSFYEHFNRQFTYAVFYIQNRTMRLIKKSLCQCFVAFCPAWELLCWSEYNQLFIGFALSSSRLVVSIQRYFSLYIKLRHFIVFYIDKLPLHKNNEKVRTSEIEF